ARRPNGITRPTGRLAARDQAFDVPYTARKDEIGGLAKALSVFKDNAGAMAKMHAEQAKMKHRADAEKRRTMVEFAGKFEASVQAVVGEVITDAGDMRKAAQSMSETAGTASGRS